MAKTASKEPAAVPAEGVDTTPLPANYEAAQAELEELVARMEGGELSLDESLSSFERGIGLYRHCQQALENAELRVRMLLDPDAPDTAEPFEPEL